MTRSPAKAPSFTKTQLAKAIKDDDAKRRSKSAAKRAAKKAPAKAAQEAAKADAAAREAEHAARDKTAEQAAYIATLKSDARAVWFGGLTEVEQEEVNNGERDCPEQFITDYVAKELDLPAGADDRKKRELTYFGPMLALRTAAKSYVKAKNGILCNGDALANAVGHLTREDVCKALIAAMKLEGNPYTHLNPGQQSMNLRNKARQAIKAGTLTIAEVRAAAKTPAEVQTDDEEDGDE